MLEIPCTLFKLYYQFLLALVSDEHPTEFLSMGIDVEAQLRDDCEPDYAVLRQSWSIEMTSIFEECCRWLCGYVQPVLCRVI